MVEYADKEYSETKSLVIKCDNTKPVPKPMQISEAHVGAGSCVSLLTPQPKDTMPGNCVGHDNPSDDMESLDHCPDQLAVCDEVTKSTHSPMLVYTATDMGRP